MTVCLTAFELCQCTYHMLLLKDYKSFLSSQPWAIHLGEKKKNELSNFPCPINIILVFYDSKKWLILISVPLVDAKRLIITNNKLRLSSSWLFSVNEWFQVKNTKKVLNPFVFLFCILLFIYFSFSFLYICFLSFILSGLA